MSRNKNKYKKTTPVNMANQNMPYNGDANHVIKYEFELQRIFQDIATYKNALRAAEDYNYPNRTELLRLYRDVILDAQITACIQTRKNAILSSQFIVIKNDVEVEELTKLISKKQWFYDFIDLSLDSIYWGYSLIQFGDLINDEFVCCDLACLRQYVKQEFHLIVQNPAEQEGINYQTTFPLNEWLIGVGKERDLGLLSKLAPYYLFKKQAMSAWANYSNLFGVPIRIAKTDKRNMATRQEMINFLKNMGNSAWGVFDKDDEIQLLEGSKSSGQDVFDRMVDRCNSEIAKLILGQTGTTDEKAYSGSANVHERILKMYTESDQRFIENIFTHHLIPFLIKYHGFPLQGCKITIKDDDKFTAKENAENAIALLNTASGENYIMSPETIKQVLGLDVELKDVIQDTKVKNKLNEYYGD